MEAHGVREFPPDSLRGRFVRRALQAAVIDVILPAFAEQVLAAGAPRAAADAATSPPARTVYLQARTHYGIVDHAVLDVAASRLAGGARRPATSTRSTTCTRGSIWIPDGELERLDDAAREYRRDRRRARGHPTPTAAGEPAERPGDGRGSGAARRRRPARGADGGAGAGSLADALEQAIANARADQLEQLDEDVDLQQVLARRRCARRRRRPKLGRGRGTGLPTGRMPDRGVDRPPYPDEVQHARRYANRLRQAITHGTRQIDKRTPGGRFDGRAYARGRAEQAAGRPVTTHPWRVTRQVARADPGAARRADHRHLRIDGRLRVRARTDRLDPHRRAAPDRRPLRDRPVRQQRRAARPTAPDRCRSFPGSAPAAAPRSPATRSSSSPTSSR